MSNKRIALIVEDNELNRDILEAMLEDDYEVLTADNGKDGLDILMTEGQGISVILLDILMPVMDGYEFLQVVKADGRYTDVPIIVTTASGSTTNEIRCLDLGASDFISKPYNADVIKKRISSLVRLRETSAMLNRVGYDNLTGLYIREFFFEYAESKLKKNPNAAYDMVCMELHAFDILAEHYGDEKVDELIKFLARHIVANLPEDCVYGRIRPNVFAILMPHTNIAAHEDWMNGDWGKLRGIPIPNIVVKMGVYANVPHDGSIKMMCDNAIMAIDKIREHYGVYIAEYDDTLRERKRMKQTLVECMVQSLKNGEFKVFYQPKYDLKNNRVGGAEALVRWMHPTLGFINPGVFIPIFEQNGFVYELDKYMLREAAKNQREWLDRGFKPNPVSVNISRADFDADELDKELESIVDSVGTPHELIHFEVTESAYSDDPQKIPAVVRRLRERGFEIELDDFGSGYSSLNVVNDITVDVLKIDMSLIRNMLKPRNKQMLKLIMAFAEKFEIDIIAEGVEYKEQADGLREIAPPHIAVYAQGYLYSKPIPGKEFEEYMHKQRALEGVT